MLYEMVDLDEERLAMLNMLIRQKEKIAKTHNKKLKSKEFSSEDYIWKVIMPMDQRDWILGKWLPNWDGPFWILQVFSNNTYEIEELALDKQILWVNGKYLKRYKLMLQEIRIEQE